MITRFLRRLHGLEDAAKNEHASAPDGSAREPPSVEGSTLPTDLLHASFVRHLLATAPGTPVVAGLAGDIAERLDAQCQRLDVARLPRLPSTVPLLLTTMRAGFDPHALANVLLRDAALAGEVMRLGGGGGFHGAESTSGLQKAIETLGDDALRHAVLAAILRPILHADPSHEGEAAGHRLAMHAEARIRLCGSLADPTNAGDIQLASVVASTGVAALLRMMPRPLLTQAAADPAFAPRLLDLAAELSARTAAQWRLGEVLQKLLRCLPADADPSPDRAALHHADLLATLHVLRSAGLAGDDAHVSDGVDARVRDSRLLAALRELDAHGLAA